MVSSISNHSMYQKHNNYYNYIYYDDKDLIRRELKYIPTPVMILLDDKKKIIDVFSPKDTLEKSHKPLLNLVIIF